ncbi:unnamed protein product [Rotaria magnacalcarata]|uniref:Uncharacterized protein n=2 Tax=Rotaria magnacalcarata TaxID=392030 RepID=A0A820FFB5_9BILA|nr:unnamed protein product [Rotaria magnacalcarata]
MNNDIGNYVKPCIRCNQNNPIRRKPAGHLKPIESPFGVRQLLSMDFHGPIIPTSRRDDKIGIPQIRRAPVEQSVRDIWMTTDCGLTSVLLFLCSLGKSCTNTRSCDFQCNVGRGDDGVQKSLAVGGGAALINSGVGIRLTWNASERTGKGESMNGKAYLIDITYGAVTGLPSGGVGAAGETRVASVVRQGTKEVAQSGAKT